MNGVLVTCRAIGIESWTDSTPPRPGENLPRPFRPGEKRRDRYHGARTQVLAMWVSDWSYATDLPAGSAQAMRANLNDNIDRLKAVFAASTITVARTRRTSAGLVTLTATAEARDVIEFQPDDEPSIRRLGVELAMADPYWYGSSVTVAVPVFTTQAHTNVGQVPGYTPTVRFVGPLTSPELRITSTSPNVVLRYEGAVASGHFVDVDTDSLTAKVDGVTLDVGNVRHSGSDLWFPVPVGAATMTLTAAAGTGSAQVTYSSAYL